MTKLISSNITLTNIWSVKFCSSTCWQGETFAKSLYPCILKGKLNELVHFNVLATFGWEKLSKLRQSPNSPMFFPSPMFCTIYGI